MSLTFEGFELDLDRYELRGADGPVALEPQAFEVLSLLVQNRDRVVSKQELLDHVWESQFVSDSALTTRIKEVRRALGDDGRTQRFVRTVHRRGYHFVAETSADETTQQADVTTTDHAPSSTPAVTATMTVEAPAGFVGREAELERLGVALDAAIGGSGGVALLAGEPGIGKTSVVRQLEARAAGQGALVLWGRARETAGAPPYHLWIQIGTAYARARAVGELALGPHANELARLFPGLPAIAAGVTAPEGPSDPASTRFRLFEAFVAFLRAAAEREPVVVVLDDLHWADEATLELLQHLGSELASMPLLVVGTYRDTEIERAHPLARTTALLARERGFARIDLEGLTESEVGDYVEVQSGRTMERSLVGRVHRRTEGNPFFVEQIVQLLADSGQLTPDAGRAAGKTSQIAIPDGVRETLALRLERLSIGARDALQLAAIVGRTFDLAILAVLLDEGDDAVLGWMEEGLSARAIEELDEPGRYRFVHALMQETLREEVSATRQARIHGSIAEALEAALGSEQTRETARLAYHFGESARLDSGHAAKTVHYSERAASLAEAQSAWGEAILHYQRSLQFANVDAEVESDEAVLQLALGRSQAYHHLPRDAWRNLIQALHAFAAREDWTLAAETALLLGELVAPPAKLVELLSIPLDGGGAAVPSALRAELLSRRAQKRFTIGDEDTGWRDDVEEARTLLDGRDLPRPEARLLRIRAGLQRNEPGSPSQFEPFQTAAQKFLEIGEVDTAGESMWQGLSELLRTGDLQTLERALGEFLEFARQHGLRRWAHMGQFVAVRLCLLRGDAAAADALVVRDMPRVSHVTHTALAAIAELRPWPPRDLDAILPQPAHAGGDPMQTLAAYAARFRLHTLTGRSEAAAEDEAAMRSLTPHGSPAVLPPVQMFLMAGDTVAELGELSFVEWCRDWLTLHGHTYAGFCGVFENVRGRIALRLGDLDAADRHLQAAVADATEAGWPVDAGRGHQALANLARRRGDLEGAAHHADEAATRFREFGADVFLQQLEAEAEA